MSRSDIENISHTAGEIREALEGASMEYQNALAVANGLRVIESLAQRAASSHAEEVREHLAIIEGLLANWPHTEIIRHYTASEKPVLMKEEALKRASILLKSH